VSPLQSQIVTEIQNAGGWIGFERFMAMALYSPGRGYYARGDRQFGTDPSSGSDFITAPEMSPMFGRALARQVAQALDVSGTDEVWEFGAGSGALASQLLEVLGDRIRRYTIVDLSSALRARQQATVAARVPQHLDKLTFALELPAHIRGVVVGNELLDAMPVVLLHFDGQQWFERGVSWQAGSGAGHFTWADRPTDLRPPPEAMERGGFVPDTVVELPRQASGFMRTLAATLERGAAFLIDYGFPELEFYHPQRTGGTLMCHRAHQADDDPLDAVGEKDITAHVDFTAVALAAQDAGMNVLGYTTQAHFLFNCGITDDLQAAHTAGDIRAMAMAQKLITEHEMGELFKVLAVASGDIEFEPMGFIRGDRMHTL
jgi:SAM-dependent MidA family methyltransferase